MTNEIIRTKLFANEVKQWELAQELNISEPYLTKILRNEITGERLQHIMAAIDAIIARKEGADHAEDC